MSKIQHAPVISLCPTQLTVGLIEVEAKKKKLQTLSPKDLADFLAAHPMPVVLGMAGMADQHDLTPAGGIAAALVVHLGDQRAGRIDHWQSTLGRPLLDTLRDAVGREDHHRALGDLVGLLDEDRALLF